MSHSRLAACAIVILATARPVAAQSLPINGAELADSTTVGPAITRLAEQALLIYHDDNRRTYLDNRFRLQLVAGQYNDAIATIDALRALNPTDSTAQAAATNLQYVIYARAKSLQATNGHSFGESFAQAFRETMATLDDRIAAMVMRSFAANRFPMQGNLRRAVSAQQDKSAIALPEALALVRAWQMEQAYRRFDSEAPPLIAEDDARRYLIARDIPVRTPEGATSCVLVVRPRHATGPLPALMEFTIYADSVAIMNEARRSASNGFVGVEALTRGKGCSPDQPVPYEHDGTDAAAVITWISQQSWSDGRVGMFGGSYNGFTQWAAAKHSPPALKAIMPSVTVAPGIDVPMEGNVFQSFVYYWPFYAATGKGLDDEALNDNQRWQRLNEKWYASGAAYRTLDQIDGTPNPIFDRWLTHPGYDAYWQAMIPCGDEFAHITIPVLTTTGYYDGGEIGALYYLTQHYHYNPRAQHYLVVGPYDHIRGQRGTVSSLGDEFTNLRGLQLDSAAHLDLGELRYQWFNYVLRGAPRPALLSDRINYEVMGANAWKHAPSIAAMSTSRRRFYFAGRRDGEYHAMDAVKPGPAAGIDLTVNLADRTDLNRVPPGNGMFDKVIDTWNSITFISAPFDSAAEISGFFAGRLNLTTNKRDLDLFISLYELTPDGDYLWLSYCLARASYLGSRTTRQLLTPGKREVLSFQSGRMTSRQLQRGSRVVVVVSAVKQPDIQINYGTGRDVSDETITDAGAPLQIHLLGGSFLEIPLRTE